MGRYCAKAILSLGSGNRDQSEQGVKNFVFKPYSCLIVGHYSHEVANTFSVLNLFSFLNLVSIPIPPSPPFLCPSLPPVHPLALILLFLPYPMTSSLPYSASTHPLEIPIHFGSVLRLKLILSSLLLPFVVLSSSVFISNINFLPPLAPSSYLAIPPITGSMTNA